MSSTRFAILVVAALAHVLLVLLADRPGLVPQLALGGVTGLVLVGLVRGLRLPGHAITVAMVMATALEILGSLIWGLYRYRSGTIPLYVPFGHGIFYALALASAAQEPLRRYSTGIVRGVLLVGTIYVSASLVLLDDVAGLVMWALAVLVIATARTPLLLATCCAYTVLLEWTGTAIGNWRWAPLVPGWELSSANPPSGVAICYCLVDLLTVALCARPWILKASNGSPGRGQDQTRGEGEPDAHGVRHVFGT